MHDLATAWSRESWPEPRAERVRLLSVIVPVRDEGPNILPLIEEIRAALGGRDFEIVYVDDGSRDDTALRLEEARQTGAPLKRRRHLQSCGQSAAIVTGVRAASGIWIATLDGDGQNDPADIDRMLDRAIAEQRRSPRPVLVNGHRRQRQDTVVKRLASRAANLVRARLLGDGTPDAGCGIKVFRREAFLELPHFDHMHRFMPALFLRGGGRVISIPVNHRPRRSGRSKYGTLDRLVVGLFDLVGVLWLQRRWRRPEVEDPDPIGAP
jgi:dolichol-phosphate mannosyltransferase